MARSPYSRFLRAFPRDEECDRSETFPKLDCVGADQFPLIAGCSYRGGLYRTHDPRSSRRWRPIVRSAFQIKADVVPIAYDWLGRQFCVNTTRPECVFLFDIDFAEVLEIPTDLVSFHDQELVDDPEAALAESFYKKWRKNDAQPLRKSECLGHVKPPFLGGKDEVGNLQRIDMEVLWSIHGQLLKNMGWRYEEA